ncbi:piggyBac transposable element-derived protein 4 [Biomphalaria glabrata]|nr:piggyBac transposable element-derived protein 4 [Biomphalaria glabrata]
MVIGFRGRWQYKMFNATKPSKYHIKTFGLCDSATGYVVDILTYFGANTSYNPDVGKDGGQAVQVFDTLLQHVETEHKIFADRFYTTRKLINYLLQQKSNTTQVHSTSTDSDFQKQSRV